MNNFIAFNDKKSIFEINHIYEIFKSVKEGNHLYIVFSPELLEEYVFIKENIEFKNKIFDRTLYFNGVYFLIVSLDESIVSEMNNKLLSINDHSNSLISTPSINFISQEAIYRVRLIITKSLPNYDFMDDDYLFEMPVKGFNNSIVLYNLFLNYIEKFEGLDFLRFKLDVSIKTVMNGKIAGTANIILISNKSDESEMSLPKTVFLSKQSLKEFQEYHSLFNENEPIDFQVFKTDKEILKKLLNNKKLVNQFNLLESFFHKVNFYIVENEIFKGNEINAKRLLFPKT